VRYQALRTRPDITPQPVLDIDRTAAYELLTQAWSESETVFTDPATAARIVATYGIQVPAAEVVTEVETAIEAAEDLGYPVALKLIARDVVHKADTQGGRGHPRGSTRRTIRPAADVWTGRGTGRSAAGRGLPLGTYPPTYGGLASSSATSPAFVSWTSTH